MPTRWPRRLPRRTCTAFALLLLAGLVAPLPGPAPAQQHEFKGPAGCVDCHTAPNPLRFRDLILLNESTVWMEQDKHSKAFELLKGELGQAMARRLKIADVLKDRRCLSCHSNWHTNSPAPPPFHDLGVTCESCHGPSSNWLAPHSEPAWRGKTPEEKLKLGMVEVREPLGRARQCFSCHIGNTDEGKVVTHEMYAAGHPPLPGIEIESFAEQMPPHWRNLRERGSFEQRDKFLAANYPGLSHDPLQDLPRTKGVVVGGVLALQSAVRLLASQLAVAKDGERELAVFDCGACHHDLRSPSWRQERGYHGLPPGRPVMAAWPAALLKLGLRQEAGADEARFKEQSAAFEAKLKSLREAVAARPFGDSEKVRAAADEIDLALENLAQKISKTPFDEAAARRALNVLCEPTEELPDFHSARQIAWSIRTIYVELNTAYPSFGERPAAEESRAERRAREDKNAEALFAWKAGPRAETAARIDQLLAGLEFKQRLVLDLPAGQKYKVEEALRQTFKQMADYDARWFKKQLAEVKKGL